MKWLGLSVSLILSSLSSWGGCQIFHAPGIGRVPVSDPLNQILSSSSQCPSNAIEFARLLEETHLKVIPAMVGNRGFHNPEGGSFSFFEEVRGVLPKGQEIKRGEFFFGHFTAAEEGKLVLDQSPDKGKLMIELIIWDSQKEMFNFYEMIGDGEGGKWFYRGDSKDILGDNKFLHRTPPAGIPKFGNTLRCAACHVSGGPIMKELALPHNDWWTKKLPLPFGSNRPDSEVAAKVAKLTDAEEFALSVREGIIKLEKSGAFVREKGGMTLQEQLRPLFCDTEINLASDLNPLQISDAVQVPSSFLINPLLGKASFKIKTEHYLALLKEFRMKFPEINKSDADHAWLVPVKGDSDILAIQSLIDHGIINADWAGAILAFDQENSLLSKARCELLKFVPERKNNLPSSWQKEFLENMERSLLPAALTLKKNLQGASLEKIKKDAQDFLDKIQIELTTVTGRRNIFIKLIRDRKAVFSSEISKNPRGQILEPGFRVIFPVTEVAQ